MAFSRGKRTVPLLIGVTLLMGVQLWAVSALAEVPALINYQASLSDSTGDPVPDGTYTVLFRIYDAETGGTELWQESHEVTTSGGWFSVYLGSTNPLSDSMFTSPCWLSVAVSQPAGGMAVYGPGRSAQQEEERALLASVPGALAARTAALADSVAPGSVGTEGLADGAVDASKIAAGAITGDNITLGGVDQGYVRIGQLQICWGVVAATNPVAWNVIIYFPVPFADTNYSLSALSTGPWGFVAGYSMAKQTWGCTGLTMLDYNGHYETGNVQWIAIGKW